MVLTTSLFHSDAVLTHAAGTAKGRSPSKQDVRQAIQAQYAQMTAAFGQKDASILKKIATPDSQFQISNGLLLNLNEMEAFQQQLLHGRNDFKQSVEIHSLKLQGKNKDALVTTTWTADSIITSLPSLEEKAAKIHEQQQVTDTWIPTPTGWRLKLSTTLAFQTKIDDQTVQAIATPLPVDSKFQKAVVHQMRQQAIPLKTVAASQGFNDLMPLKKVIGDSRIVALGEATQGSREFFQMKHRLWEFLVKYMGFTVFAIEANWPETQAVDRYIKTGEGDPKQALAGMYFWTWDTQEFLDMIEWMRAYNQAPGNRPLLSFTGFDMQFPDIAMSQVADFFGKLSPVDAQAVNSHYACLRGVDRLGFRKLEKIVQDACRLQVDEVVKLFEVKHKALLDVSTPAEFRDALQSANIVQQAVGLWSSHPLNASELRDRAMANNINWLANSEYPGQKIVLWAHNGQVGSSTQVKSKSMGSYLRSDFGSQMYVFGFAFDRGEVRAVPFQDGHPEGQPIPLLVPPAANGSSEVLFRAVGFPRFILDFHIVEPKTEQSSWLASSHPLREIAAAYDQKQPFQPYLPLAFSKTFDGIVYIEESHATNLLSERL